MVLTEEMMPYMRASSVPELIQQLFASSDRSSAYYSSTSLEIRKRPMGPVVSPRPQPTH